MKSQRPTPRRRRRRRPRNGRWLLALLAAAGLVVLSRGLWQPPLPPPQMILVLGGDVERERVAADLAARDGLPVLVSGGSNPEYAHWLFGRQGLDHGRVQLDYRATDTLTNFTSIVDELKRAKVRHVLLVTSSDHMQRAMPWAAWWLVAAALASRRWRCPVVIAARLRVGARCGGMGLEPPCGCSPAATSRAGRQRVSARCWRQRRAVDQPLIQQSIDLGLAGSRGDIEIGPFARGRRWDRGADADVQPSPSAAAWSRCPGLDSC